MWLMGDKGAEDNMVTPQGITWKKPLFPWLELSDESSTEQKILQVLLENDIVDICTIKYK